MMKVECRFCKIQWEIDGMADLEKILEADCYIRRINDKHEVRGIL